MVSPLTQRSKELGEERTNRHIIQPLRTVPIQLPLLVLRRNPIQRITHIGPNILIPVLIQTQGTTRMLDEQIQKSNFIVFDFGDGGDDVVGDEVRAPGSRREGDGFLGPRHDGGFGMARWGERGGKGTWEEEFEWKGPEGVEQWWEEGDEEDQDEDYV
ncbi:hypothetical protein DSL72_008864 [Monilinia vaccinii-corymbosi]|uniref:Uncharacterized protein n=1 Tax=Monilinia vaccinii-corymbosi TaxID=61207 RepID=A0A8A3PSC6_9HELO|nr:hypothetical protein DSL72_008864 [Monilinia vaccinii-corymbosi]